MCFSGSCPPRSNGITRASASFALTPGLLPWSYKDLAITSSPPGQSRSCLVSRSYLNHNCKGPLPGKAACSRVPCIRTWMSWGWGHYLVYHEVNFQKQTNKQNPLRELGHGIVTPTNEKPFLFFFLFYRRKKELAQISFHLKNCHESSQLRVKTTVDTISQHQTYSAKATLFYH